MKKYKNIFISGSRWFQKTYGNTYCKVSICVDGKTFFECPEEYGYGDFYLQKAGYELVKQGYFKDYSAFTEAMRKHDGSINVSVQDIEKYRDFKNK